MTISVRRNMTIETPPRAWRRLTQSVHILSRPRNTSTSVEKTLMFVGERRKLKKHLHERGEDSAVAPNSDKNSETPPRAWRRQRFIEGKENSGRNTSTSVEKTKRSSTKNSPRWKHLHERGEDGVRKVAPYRGKETPPRAWRRRYLNWVVVHEERNTSTSVEKTPLYCQRANKQHNI